MRRYRGLFRPSGAFSRHQFLPDYTISTFGFDFRQPMPWKIMPIGMREWVIINQTWYNIARSERLSNLKCFFWRQPTSISPFTGRQPLFQMLAAAEKQDLGAESVRCTLVRRSEADPYNTAQWRYSAQCHPGIFDMPDIEMPQRPQAETIVTFSPYMAPAPSASIAHIAVISCRYG
jgi:hypothetical protein